MVMSVEERIDRVLAETGAAEAPAGLEGRVLARLAEVRAAEGRAGGGSRGAWVRRLVVCGCVGVVVAVVGVSVVRTDRAARAPGVGQSREAGLAQRQEFHHPGDGRDSLRLRSPDFPWDARLMRRPGGPGRGRSPGAEIVGGGAVRLDVQGGGDAMDDIAVSEMRAPSLPAPAEPLTAQERLLLRAGRAPGVSALAESDPEADAALLAAQVKRQGEVHELFAAFGRGVFAGMDAGANAE